MILLSGSVAYTIITFIIGIIELGKDCIDEFLYHFTICNFKIIRIIIICIELYHI